MQTLRKKETAFREREKERDNLIPDSAGSYAFAGYYWRERDSQTKREGDRSL